MAGAEGRAGEKEKAMTFALQGEGMRGKKKKINLKKKCIYAYALMTHFIRLIILKEHLKLWCKVKE